MKTIIRFDNVSFAYSGSKEIIDEASFSVRQGMKVALMGQNGAGKSTLFKLLTGELKENSGKISVDNGITVATAYQVIPEDEKELTLEEFFAKRCKNDTAYEIKSKIARVLDAVNLKAEYARKIKSFSGGQQARLLMASALIQNPDLLLLDEPTNNLDQDGINHLMLYLIQYPKSVIVISHDAEFLNVFTQGVLYLDSHTKKTEQYQGDYHDVVATIAAKVEQERRKNAQMEREIQANKDKANFFAHKGGKMRLVAKKMRNKAEELENEKVDSRKEDKTIKNFTIPVQSGISGEVLRINSFSIFQNDKALKKTANVFVAKNTHLLISGPNGIGKSTLIKSIALGNSKGYTITPGVRVGYYSQDFSTLDFGSTVWDSLLMALTTSDSPTNEQVLRSTAAGFLITGDMMGEKIGSLSEGQKGLLSFAQLVLMEPGLLILDEPTNHINFRHIPIIAKAISDYAGALVLVSHIPEFVSQIRIDDVLDLGK